MNDTFKFSIQNLLSQKEGRVSAPMSPMLFAGEVADTAGFRFNRIARINFADERTHQQQEDCGLTGFDTLVIGEVYQNDIWLTLWVDTGTGGIPVAAAFLTEQSAMVTDTYRNTPFAKKLNEEEIKQIFHTLFENPGLMDVRQDGQ